MPSSSATSQPLAVLVIEPSGKLVSYMAYVEPFSSLKAKAGQHYHQLFRAVQTNVDAHRANANSILGTAEVEGSSASFVLRALNPKSKSFLTIVIEKAPEAQGKKVVRQKDWQKEYEALALKHHALLMNNAAGYIYLNLDLKILEANDEVFMFLSSFRRGSPLRKSIYNYLDPRAADILRSHLATTPKEPVGFDMVLQLSKNHKEQLWADVSAHLNEDGEIVGYYVGFVPVTDKQLLIHKLQESESRYQALIRHSRDVFLIVDDKAIVQYAQGAAELVLGYSIEKLLGTNIRKLLHPEDRNTANRWASALYAYPQRSLSFVVRYLHADKQYRIGDITATVLQVSPENAIQGMVITISDITERKRSEEALWGYLQLVDGVFSQASEGLMVVDPKNWEVVHINQKAVAYFGGNRNSLADHKPSKATTTGKNLRKLVRDALEHTTEGQEHVMQILHWEMPDGKVRQVEVHASSLKMGSRLLNLLRFSDVTEREAAQKDMKLLRTAVASTRDAILICSYEKDILNAKFRFANPAFETLLGYQPEELPELTLARLLSPLQASQIGKKINQRLNRQLPFLGEVLSIKKDGTEIECQWQLNLMLENGKPANCIIVLHDVSELKAVQRSVMQQRLEQQKLVMSTVLNTQEQERKRIAEDIHDGLGHSLSVLKYNISILEDKLREMPQSIHDLLAQTRQIADEANTEARNISRNLVPSVLYDFGISSAIRHLLRNVNPDDRIKIEYNPTPIDGRLDGTVEIALYRILQELLNNIVKYAQASQIRLELVCEGEMLSLVVDDNGKGFDYEAIRKKGGGMGLRNIESRVKLLNGIFVLDAQVGKGTTAIIQLPIVSNINTSL